MPPPDEMISDGPVSGAAAPEEPLPAPVTVRVRRPNAKQRRRIKYAKEKGKTDDVATEYERLVEALREKKEVRGAPSKKVGTGECIGAFFWRPGHPTRMQRRFEQRRYGRRRRCGGRASGEMTALRDKKGVRGRINYWRPAP